MKIREICKQPVITAFKNDSAYKIASLMATNNVGYVIIVEKTDAGMRPVGIITNRDLILKVIANNRVPNNVAANDIMTDVLVTVSLSFSIAATLRLMDMHNLQCLPVIDHHQMLVGVITSDDLRAYSRNRFAVNDTEQYEKKPYLLKVRANA